MVKLTKGPCRNDFKTEVSDLDSDYANLVNSFQRHSRCSSAYCLREDQGNHYCRFHYLFALESRTYLRYNEVPMKGGKHFRVEIVTERNDPRVNRYQGIQLQGWRANCDIQLVIDHYACIEYLARYAAKAEKLSSIARGKFENVVGDVSEKSSPKSVLQKLFIKLVGERDMGVQYVMHQILSLKLCNSSFRARADTAENSCRCEMTLQEMKLQGSHMDICANRGLLFHGKELELCNLIDFFAKYQVIGHKLIITSKPTIIRTVPNFSSNPKGNNYDKYLSINC